MDAKFIFGAAYYEEYLPCDRLEHDMALIPPYLQYAEGIIRVLVSRLWETRNGYNKPGPICAVEYDPVRRAIVGYPKKLVWRHRPRLP